MSDELRVGDYMSEMPYTVGAEQPLSVAHRLMRQHHIRHLPVLTGGKLVGVVSLRDLHLVETLDGVDPDDVKVEDAMTDEVYAVAPDTPLAQVVTRMAEQRMGSALVMDGDRLVGLFSTVDALRALADLLLRR